MKFAYLILTHNNFIVLQHLVSMLDDSRNDIFIHFDRKVRNLPELHAEHSRLVILDNRVDVRWGTVSQIKAIFALLEAARTSGEYDYFHLISGTHLPLKNQDYIHDHFAGFNGASALGLWKINEPDADFKLRRIHFWINNFQSAKPFVRFIVQHIWTVNMFIQKKLGIRIYKDRKFIKANEWASISKESAGYLIDHEKEIISKYRFSFCGDEYYLASELSGNCETIDDQELLYVFFEKDHPRTLTEDDYELLKSSNYLFARKFDDSFFMNK